MTGRTYPWIFVTQIFRNGSIKRYILHMWLLLHINGKFTMGTVKSSLLGFFLIRPSLSVSRCRSRYEADLAVDVASFITNIVFVNFLNSINDSFSSVPISWLQVISRSSMVLYSINHQLEHKFIKYNDLTGRFWSMGTTIRFVFKKCNAQCRFVQNNRYKNS
jgi:hypothetical protein